MHTYISSRAFTMYMWSHLLTVLFYTIVCHCRSRCYVLQLKYQQPIPQHSAKHHVFHPATRLCAREKN